MQDSTTRTLPGLAGNGVAALRLLKAPALPVLRVDQLLLAVAVWIATTQNGLLWTEVMKSLPGPPTLQGSGIVVAVLMVLLSANLLIAALFSARRLLRPGLILLVMVAAVCSYFMDRFHVVIDQSMILNSVQTDRHEAGELIGLPLAWHLLAWGLLPSLFVARVPLRREGLLREAGRRLGLIALLLALTAACVFAQYRSVSSWGRNNADMRMYPNPTYPLYSAWKFAHKSFGGGKRKAPLVIGADATRSVAAAGRRPQVLVLVIGETARAANFELDGYSRPTNPELSAIPGLVNFSNVWSCGTATAVSVPCMFFHEGQRGFSKGNASESENLLDVLQRAGLPVLWRNNNSGCKEVCDRVETENLANAGDPVLCGADGCYDEILLDRLADRLEQGGDRVVVLHTKGSHGPSYYKRVPAAFRHFQPTCDSDDLQQCSPEQIVNSYDNTIAYTDHVLARLIALLQERDSRLDSTMIYIADHGESLGENGIYLHGMPYGIAPDMQKHVPMMAWFSPGMLQAQGLDAACLQSRRGERYSHDNLFSTVLGLLSVKTVLYKPELDLLGACRSTHLADAGAAATR